MLTAAALLAAGAAIVSHYAQRTALHYVFKPLATLLIVILALLLLPSTPPLYGWLIVAGLLCSLAGDIFLMLPRDRFLAGLTAFLLAHWCYMAAFLQRTPDPNVMLLLPWLAAAAAVLFVLRPPGSMRYAVAVYVGSIVAMAWLAFENWRLAGAMLAAAGAVLFVCSDFLIGLRRFRGSWPAERALTLGTYFPAQLLITHSMGFSGTVH